MTPEKLVDGEPVKFTLIVNGANPHKQVSSDGGHYVPATVIAKKSSIQNSKSYCNSGLGRSNVRLRDK